MKEILLGLVLGNYESVEDEVRLASPSQMSFIIKSFFLCCPLSTHVLVSWHIPGNVHSLLTADFLSCLEESAAFAHTKTHTHKRCTCLHLNTKVGKQPHSEVYVCAHTQTSMHACLHTRMPSTNTYTCIAPGTHSSRYGYGRSWHRRRTFVFSSTPAGHSICQSYISTGNPSPVQMQFPGYLSGLIPPQARMAPWKEIDRLNWIEFILSWETLGWAGRKICWNLWKGGSHVHVKIPRLLFTHVSLRAWRRDALHV